RRTSRSRKARSRASAWVSSSRSPECRVACKNTFVRGGKTKTARTSAVTATSISQTNDRRTTPPSVHDRRQRCGGCRQDRPAQEPSNALARKEGPDLPRDDRGDALGNAARSGHLQGAHGALRQA